MKRNFLLPLPFLISLTLGFAGATDGTAPTPAPAPTTPTTATIKNTLKNLQGHVATGSTVTIVDASGTTLATLNADGTYTVTGDLSTATGVKLTASDGTESAYELAARGVHGGQLFVKDAAGKSLPLVAVMNKSNAAAKRDSGTPDTGTPETGTPETEPGDGDATTQSSKKPSAGKGKGK